MDQIVDSQDKDRDASYFTWDNLAELAGLDSHLSFAGELIKKYQWPPEIKKDLTGRLDAIQKKQQDKKLNLSVIGEFSSGKSTFINALLRMDLLAANVLQGTTVASTVLEYGSEYTITTSSPDMPEKTKRYFLRWSFRKALNRLAANNDGAKELGDVRVTLPAASLEEGGFRIIDTPGLNATIQWHEDVTTRAVRDVSDLSIILVDALRPLPEDMCMFIEDHLMPVLDQCVFVVTKIDMLPPEERKRMLKYIQRTVRVKFGIDDPLVLPYASVDVLNSFIPGTCEPGKYPTDAGISLESEARILEHMARQRTIAQSRKLISLIELIYQFIQTQMTELDETYKARLAVLYETKRADLDGFISRKKEECARAFDSSADGYRAQILEASDGYVKTARDMILELIKSQTGSAELKRYMNKKMKEDCMAQAVRLCWKIKETALEGDRFAALAEQILQDFQEEFQEEFRNLKCLKKMMNIRTIEAPEIVQPQVRAIDEAGSYMKDMVKKESQWVGGGAAAGAAIGTALAPGIGTAIGAAIGFFAGRLGADNAGITLEEMKEASAAKVSFPVQSYFEDVKMQTNESVDKYCEAVKEQIFIELDRYLVAYQKTVEWWIRLENAKIAAMENKVRQIREDMDQIDFRRQTLESIRRQIEPNQEAFV